MKVFHAVASIASCESSWTIQPYRERLWCAAFQVDSLDGLFDMAVATDALPVLNAAISRFDTHTEELRALLDPQDFAVLRGNQRILKGMRKFLLRCGGHISGAIDKDELDAPDNGDEE